MIHLIIKYLCILVSSLFAFFILFWVADYLIKVITPAPKIDYGVTFSSTYSKEFGMDPKEVLQNILTDLQVKRLRLPIYWSDLEATEGKFDFKNVDSLLDLAQQNNAQVILSIGYKVPRWPECFPPSWAKDLDDEKSKEKILNLLDKTVDHFKNRPEIIAWQVENEPLLDFGICKMYGEEFLKQEVDLVRSKDTRPIVLTDSGELGLWVTALKYSDLMGSSLYRTVWNPFFGFFNYPFPPLYYRLKAFITQTIFAPNSQGVFISELQTEPWSPGKHLSETPIPEQIKIFSEKNFKDAVAFTVRTDIKQQYLWGAEWWYWMKIQGYPEYWNFAKTLFK